MTGLSRALMTALMTAAVALGILLVVNPSHAADAKSAASAVALIMIEEPGCPYCARWRAEVGQAYPRSAEGRFAPLTTYFDDDPEVGSFKNIVYSPTFVVVKGRKEIGRIVGYPGEHFFWPMLDEILVKVGFAPGKLAVRQKSQ